MDGITIGNIVFGLLYVCISFFASFMLTKAWINLAKANKLVGFDMNKQTKHEVAEAGGVAVFIAFLLSLFVYFFLKTFILKSVTHFVEVLALTVTVTLACFIGFIDDVLGWKKGLGGWKKLVTTIPIAIPLAVLRLGNTTMSIPFIGPVNFGIAYSLVIVPLLVVGFTNGFNLLAGYNGLEAGLASIIMLGFSFIFVYTKQYWLALIALAMFFSLLAFLIFNKYPSKVFPGDSLTFTVGSLIACFAILGNVEKLALFMFIPFVIEGFLKARSKFKAENFAKLDKQGYLHEPYKYIYSVTHATIKLLKSIKNRVTEQDVVAFLLLLQFVVVICVAVWLII